jgi:hypothetical protein
MALRIFFAIFLCSDGAFAMQQALEESRKFHLPWEKETALKLIAAAKNNEEPEYIELLMGIISIKNNLIASKLELCSNETTRLAWLVTLSALLNAIDDRILQQDWYGGDIFANPIKDFIAAGPYLHFRSSISSVCSAILKVANDPEWQDAWQSAYRVASGRLSYSYAIKNVAETLFKQEMEIDQDPKIKIIIYKRLAEWVVLTSFNFGIESLVADTYHAALNNLPKPIRYNPTFNFAFCYCKLLEHVINESPKIQALTSIWFLTLHDWIKSERQLFEQKLQTEEPSQLIVIQSTQQRTCCFELPNS